MDGEGDCAIRTRMRFETEPDFRAPVPYSRVRLPSSLRRFFAAESRSRRISLALHAAPKVSPARTARASSPLLKRDSTRTEGTEPEVFVTEDMMYAKLR